VLVLHYHGKGEEYNDTAAPSPVHLQLELVGALAPAVIDLSTVPERWLRHRNCSAHSTGSFSVTDVASQPACKALTLEQKYREAKLVSESTASDMAV